MKRVPTSTLSSTRLKATLAGNRLPETVQNLTGLVAYRIKSLPLAPPPSLDQLLHRAERDRPPVPPENRAPMPASLRRRIKALQNN